VTQTAQKEKPAQNKRNKFVFFLLLLIFLSLLASIVFLFTLGIIPLPSFFKGFKGKAKTGEKLVKEQVFKVKKPQPIENLRASKLIKADEGGRLVVVNPQGTEISLFIPPGALDRDQEVSLVPLAEPPAEDFDDGLGNGVLVEPEDLDFDDPVVLVFDSLLTVSCRSCFRTHLKRINRRN